MPPRSLPISRLFYWAAVISLFGWAIWQRFFSLPLDPIADPDIWGYLSPALKQLTGSGFVHAEARNFLYPGFLLLLLRFFGDFRAITIVQHLLGLSAGAFLLLTWRRARIFVVAPRLTVGSYHAVGLITAAVFLVAGEPIRAEMQIRPEGICAFLFSVNLWFAVAFIAGTFVEKRPPSPGLGIGLTFTAMLLASVKPSFIFLALVAMLPVGISFLQRGFIRQKLWLLGGAGAAAILLFVPEYFLSREDDLAPLFLPTSLFVIHADLIRDQMADDLKEAVNLPYPRDWLGRVHADLSAEIAKSRAAPENYSSIGFSPDYLMYRQTSIATRLLEEFHYDTAAVTAFYRFYYWRTWKHCPIAMLKKIGRQLAIFYAPMCPAYDLEKMNPLTIWYQIGFTSLHNFNYPDLWKAYPPAVEFMRRIEPLAHGTPAIHQRKASRRALVFLAGAYLPFLAISLLLGAVALFRREYRQRVGWLVGLTLFLLCYNAGACLEVAIIHSLDVPRYSTVQMFFTLLAEFLAARLLLESLPQSIRCGRPNHTSAQGE